MAGKIELNPRSGNRFDTWSLSGAMQGWFMRFQRAIRGQLGPRAPPIEHAPEPGTANVTPRLRLLTAIGRSLRLLKSACEASLVGM